MLGEAFILVAVSGGSSPVVVGGLLTAVTSLAVEHQLWGARPSVAEECGLNRFGSQALEHRLGSCGACAWLLHCMWDFPRSGEIPDH